MEKISLKVWFLWAARSVLRHRRKTIATGGFIILGTATLVLLHGLTVGINDTMILNTTHLHYGDVFIEFPADFINPQKKANQISNKEDVIESLFRYRFTSLVFKGSVSAPVICYAVNPETESKTTAISQRIIQGNYPRTDNKEILLGAELTEKLNATTGDNVSIIGSSGEFFGNFTISGIFKTEIDYFDNTIVFIPILAVSAGVKEKSTSELSLFFSPDADESHIAKQIKKDFPDDITIRTWEQLLPDLIQLIKLNEISTRIIMVLVFLLVGFGICNTFILTIVERFKEFGILKAMGLTPKDLVGLIFLESFIVCIIATMIGLLIGCLIISITSYQGIDFSSLTSHNRYFVVSGLVRPRITLPGLYWPGILSIIVSIISSYLPTRIASKKVTSETLRFS